jgi:hypothetical protein
MKNIEAGDVIIKNLELSNKALKARIDPTDQVVGFDIWEDMSKPTMYAEFAFQDNVGLLESFPIIGEETIKVELMTPGLSKSTTYEFKSFEVTKVQRDVNGKGSTFVLRCVSEEHLYNGSSLITQAYVDTIGNIVGSVLQRYLKTTKPLIVDETRGIQTLATPKLSPLELIDMCRLRAVSKEFQSSSYVFFENQQGFNFKTIEGLIKAGKSTIGSRIFNAQQDVMGSPEAQANAFRTILDFTNIARADSNMKAADGVYKAVTRTFDVATKSFESSTFLLTDKYSQFVTPGKKAQIPNSDDFIDKYATGVSKQFFTPKNTLAPDTLIDTAMASRNSFVSLLNSDITRAMIHGDTGLKVGDLVTLHLPDPDGLTTRKKDSKLSSGNYLIVRLRHVVTPSTRSKHRVVFDCVKMGI